MVVIALGTFAGKSHLYRRDKLADFYNCYVAIESMYLGVEGDCKNLSSRLEIYPCNFRHPDSTSEPGAK